MRGVESLSAVRVKDRSASAALWARVNIMEKAITRLNFTRSKTHSWRVPTAPGMRPVIGFYIFGASLQNFVQSTKSKETYTTV